MNQQLIFNHDFQLTVDQTAVSCSVLLAGLRISVMIQVPAGWLPQDWLIQVKADDFCWEEQIEEALAAEQLSADGILYL